MRYRPLGSTGIEISELSFGAGPIAGLMTDTAAEQRQCETIARALELGVNWFDTAAKYAERLGKSVLVLRQ